MVHARSSAWFFVLFASACTQGAVEKPADAAPQVLVGSVTRSDILTTQPRWAAAMARTTPSDDASALASVPAGAVITVYLGTWCGDSVRELTQLWAALDTLGAPPPFRIEYIGVDRSKQTDQPLTFRLAYVPTFIVSRDGHEVGRIVESAPNGIAADLAALLDGTRTGVVSGRTDL